MRPRRPRRSREQRRLRLRRHGRRAYIRSVYFLPSLATLGNAVSGFAAIYVAALMAQGGTLPKDPWGSFFVTRGFSAAAYLILLAMVFDALDGRLARFARHTTDFGGQLDSMADVVSFGLAPAFVALRLFHLDGPNWDLPIMRLVWAVAALYMCCAAIRLARFNVSNEHGEQHHFSFLVLGTGLLMVSHLRYPHLVNRYLRGRRSIGRLISIVVLLLLIFVAHQYVLGIGTLAYAAWGPCAWLSVRARRWMRPRTKPGLSS
jgi:CDP-diacylglycerol--serine O-phosphatidyltransferase